MKKRLSYMDFNKAVPRRERPLKRGDIVRAARTGEVFCVNFVVNDPDLSIWKTFYNVHKIKLDDSTFVGDEFYIDEGMLELVTVAKN
jgi:hypothetical protein